MKRTLTFITSLALFVAIFAVAQPGISSARHPTGEAVTPSKEICRTDWHGETYNLSKRAQREKYQDYKTSGCAKVDGGSCTVKSSKKDGADIKKIACQKPDASGAPTTTNDPSSNCDDAGGCYEDAALTCQTDNCNIIDNYVNPAIRVLTAVVGVAVVIGIIWGAIEVSMSAGDPQRNASGKDHIRNAIIALVAYIMLFAFLQWIIPGGLSL